MADFKLNTKTMDSAAGSCQELAEDMKSLKDELTEAKSNLMFSWQGKACNEFQKQFRLLVQQLDDVTTNLWETAERILDCQEAYFQTDTNTAKQMDGVNSGVTTVDPFESEEMQAVFGENTVSASGFGGGGGGGGSR